jgi:hypothetical protein
MSTRWPGWTLAVSTRICQAVSPASGRPPASSKVSSAGLWVNWRDGAVTYSAYALAARGNQGMPNTGSPGASLVTPSPTSSTTPATSQPTVNGGSPSTRAMPLPARVFQSTGFTPAARTRTSTSVGSGVGAGASPSSNTSGPPKAA